MDLHNLVHNLVRDMDISNSIKLLMLEEWEDRLKTARSNTLISKKQMEQHVLELEIIDNAKRMVK